MEAAAKGAISTPDTRNKGNEDTASDLVALLPFLILGGVSVGLLLIFGNRIQ